MYILITGANGFIGTALCGKLLSKKWQVRGTVRSSNRPIKVSTGINTMQTDSIGPDTNWSKALASVDCVVHLAARVHVIRNRDYDPLELFRKVNVLGTEHLAREAALANVRRFIYMSSVKLNGEGTGGGSQKSPRLNTLEGNPVQRGREVRDQEAVLKGAFSEKDSPKPQDPYGISKYEAEKILRKVSEETGMEMVILRPPLVYGPGVKANFLRLLKVVECGIPLPLASINNRRSLIYLGNLVDAIVTCIEHPRAAGNTYLVSDGEDVSTPELIRRISSALGRPSRLFPFPPVLLKMAGGITGKSAAMDKILGSLTVDCSKIRRELDWQAPFSMEQGLKETAKWYKKEARYQESEVAPVKRATLS
jgi:nucleoside-diphosphate-sugar epimerase